VDSSAVGGKFNKRVAEQTKPFWDAVGRNEIVVIVSDMLEDEVEDPRTPRRVKNFFDTSLKPQAMRIMITKESSELAARYISENVVDKNSFADCLHVALATLANADVLVSWNLTHMVNNSDGYKRINKMLGYPEIEILTPEKFMEVQHDET
jgi:predicted nucleic acid-binding protein